MQIPLFGESCALLAALAWGFAVVLFKRSGEEIAPMALNMFKNAVAIVLLALTLAVMAFAQPNQESLLRLFSPRDLWILAISGFLGITLADTLFFASLNLIGVGLISIVDCLYSPFVIFFSLLLLSEQLSVWHYLGTALILAGVYISSGHAPPHDRTRLQLIVGILLGALAIALMTFGIVIAKPTLERLPQTWSPTLWATLIRMIAGTLILAGYAAVMPRRSQQWAVFRPSPVWKYGVPASVVGGYIAMIAWIAGFQYARASIAGVLNQMSVIFAIILATFFLKEAFTLRKGMAVVLATAGVVLVTLSPAPKPDPAANPAPPEQQAALVSPAHCCCHVRFTRSSAGTAREPLSKELEHHGRPDCPTAAGPRFRLQSTSWLRLDTCRAARRVGERAGEGRRPAHAEAVSVADRGPYAVLPVRHYPRSG
ncbi:MAG: DMT family transporter [Planctomycetes bacterium]|nr:DMT family transporter [Planctomycetota bacterium]